MVRKHANYVVVAVKMPQELKDKIDDLVAHAQNPFKTSRNGWIVRTLYREAFKHNKAKREDIL